MDDFPGRHHDDFAIAPVGVVRRGAQGQPELDGPVRDSATLRGLTRPSAHERMANHAREPASKGHGVLAYDVVS
jgi:hypothetical protein